MKNSASLIYNFFLVIGDFLALVLAFAGGYILRVSLSGQAFPNQIPATTYIGIFLTILPFWILIFALLGLYNSSIYEKRFAELGRLLVGSFIGLLFVVFWNFLSVEPIFPAKLVPIYGFGLAFLFLVIFRNLARAIRSLLFKGNIGITRILIVGNTPVSDELLASLQDSRHSGYQIVGVVGNKHRVHHADYGTFAEAITHIGTNPVHGIIQTELYADEGHNREILEYAQANHLSYRFVPGNTELFVGNIDVELFRSSIPMIAVHQTALLGWGRIAKRLIDIALGGLLLIIVSPLMLVIAVVIAFGQGSPVMFRQRRLTRFNREFYVFKFRTTKLAYTGLSPEQAFIKMGKPELIQPFREQGDQIPNDPRFGRLGNFLRRTSLDELPQLLNVVRGDISLVGPRALVPQELNEYEKRHAILSVKSGLTGLAQVSGRKNISFAERRKLDLYYVQNWSLWLDVTILLKTCRVLVEKSPDAK